MLCDTGPRSSEAYVIRTSNLLNYGNFNLLCIAEPGFRLDVCLVMILKTHFTNTLIQIWKVP